MKSVREKNQILQILKSGKIKSGDTYLGDGDERFCELDGQFASGSTLSDIQGAIEWKTDAGPIFTIGGMIVKDEVVAEYKRLRKQQIRNSRPHRLGSDWRGLGITKDAHNAQVEELEKVANVEFPGLYDCVEYA